MQSQAGKDVYMEGGKTEKEKNAKNKETWNTRIKNMARQ